jgi:hypothetical protein
MKVESRRSRVPLAMRLHLCVCLWVQKWGQAGIDAMSDTTTAFKWLIIANTIIGFSACAVKNRVLAVIDYLNRVQEK